VEWNKNRLESRTIQTLPTTGETLCFPLAEQIARLRRQGSSRNGEVVSLVTSLEPAQLNAQVWLKYNRLAWTIENGLHLRLDVSQNDDRCRIRTPKGLWIMGMFRRIANSLFVHWQSQHKKPQYKTTTDFQSHIEEENLRRGMIFVSAAKPSLKPAS
jgi:hypothetical protein